jgi:hypothetical protein
MSNTLSHKILSAFSDAKIEQGLGEKFFITGVLFNGFKIEIMSNNANEFVIRYKDFDFFDKDALGKYFRKKLSQIDVKFEVNSLSIYVYIDNKRDDDFRFKIFEYVKLEIEKIINDILDLLENVENKEN